MDEVYSALYQVVRDEPLYHVEFSLKYDDFSLDFLKAVFERIPQADTEAFVNASPGSKCARKIGFLYEFLTGKELHLKRPVSGHYADLLDEEKYITL